MSGHALIPLPADTAPTLERCVFFMLPNDTEWLGMFWGALYQLTVWSSYDRDAGANGAVVANLWKDIIAAAHEGSCVDLIQFRQNTDCILQASFDGGATWSDIFNAERCITRDLNSGELASGQGGAAAPPPIGGCTVYHVHMEVGRPFILPTTVSAGDTISISNTRGAWSDGWLGNFWFCADGFFLLFGVCVGPATPAKSGDPQQSLAHMNLLGLVDGVYYDAYDATFTIPYGVTGAQISFLPNDDPAKVGGAAGSVDFDVEVCRNALTYHLVDLRNAGAIITQTGLNSWHVQQIQSGCDGFCAGSFCSLLTILDNNNQCHTAQWTMSNQTGWTQYGCATHNGGLLDCNGGSFTPFEGSNLSGDSGWQDYFNANYQTTDVGILDFRSGTTFEFDITATTINP